MATNRANRPNVIFVLTDDQGYADLGCHGNPWLRTPQIDHFQADGDETGAYYVYVEHLD